MSRYVLVLVASVCLLGTGCSSDEITGGAPREETSSASAFYAVDKLFDPISIRFVFNDGRDTWEFSKDDLLPDEPATGMYMSPTAYTKTSGKLTFEFHIGTGSRGATATGTQTVELSRDFAWWFELVYSTDEPDCLDCETIMRFEWNGPPLDGEGFYVLARKPPIVRLTSGCYGPLGGLARVNGQ